VKVTVLVITYNHVRFIRQALESVLAQQTDCDFEVLISEDCSTDGTREIVLDYAAAHPDKIYLLLSTANLHDNFVAERGIAAARGEYIAFLDGDDYWSSPHKLQKQVEFMELHPEYVMSFHQVELVDVEGRRLPNQKRHISQVTWSLRDYLVDCSPVETGSVLLRRKGLHPLPAWYRASPIGDFPLWVLRLQDGLAGYLDETLGAYRIHSESFTRKGFDKISSLRFWVRSYRDVFIHMGARHRAMMVKPLETYWTSLAYSQMLAADYKSCRRAAKEGLMDCPNSPRLLLLAYAPWAYVPGQLSYRFLCWLFGRSPKAAGE
jgi:glycosyltransferase involved in cell wall biosynthesis